jgi:thiamine transporter
LNLPFLRLQLPFNVAGGTIALNMLPLFVVALRRGVGPGVIAGALYGVVDALVDPFIVHPVQFLLDYPVAYGLTGLAGLASGFIRKVGKTGVLRWPIMLVGLLIGVIARFGSHWIAGIVFFGSYAPEGQPVWLYSLIYNAGYLLPSLALTAIGAFAVMPVLERAVPVAAREARNGSIGDRGDSDS